MFRLGKLTDYGALLMTALADEPARLHSAQELAAVTHVPPPTVAKLLKRLAKGALIEAVRGAHGGYRLSRPPAQITVADIVRALEGPIALTQCAEHNGQCSIESSCATSAHWQVINTAIREALEAVTLAQLSTLGAVRRSSPASGTARPLVFDRDAGRRAGPGGSH